MLRNESVEDVFVPIPCGLCACAIQDSYQPESYISIFIAAWLMCYNLMLPQYNLSHFPGNTSIRKLGPPVGSKWWWKETCWGHYIFIGADPTSNGLKAGRSVQHTRETGNRSWGRSHRSLAELLLRKVHSRPETGLNYAHQSVDLRRNFK